MHVRVCTICRQLVHDQSAHTKVTGLPLTAARGPIPRTHTSTPPRRAVVTDAHGTARGAANLNPLRSQGGIEIHQCAPHHQMPYTTSVGGAGDGLMSLYMPLQTPHIEGRGQIQRPTRQQD